MPVTLENIREHLLPGLYQITASQSAVARWEEAFEAWNAAAIELPPIPLAIAIPFVAAATIVKNPETTRRGLLSWLSSA